MKQPVPLRSEQNMLGQYFISFYLHFYKQKPPIYFFRTLCWDPSHTNPVELDTLQLVTIIIISCVTQQQEGCWEQPHV